jgi:coenzyme PQQ precursor peptide PqqA
MLIVIKKRWINILQKILKEKTMNWTTPAAQDMRFGFEITLYIANR